MKVSAGFTMPLSVRPVMQLITASCCNRRKTRWLAKKNSMPPVVLLTQNRTYRIWFMLRLPQQTTPNSISGWHFLKASWMILNGRNGRGLLQNQR
jgi:hypothetical protein